MNSYHQTKLLQKCTKALEKAEKLKAAIRKESPYLIDLISNSIKTLQSIQAFSQNPYQLHNDEYQEINLAPIALLGIQEYDLFSSPANKVQVDSYIKKLCQTNVSLLKFISKFSRYDKFLKNNDHIKQFFKKHDVLSKQEQINYLTFTQLQSVRIISIPMSTILYQWHAKNNPQGSFYTPNANEKPSKLGINDYVIDRTNNTKVKRIEKHYETRKTNVEFLESIAAAIHDDFSVPSEKVKTKGGGTQYFNRNDKSYIKEI